MADGKTHQKASLVATGIMTGLVAVVDLPSAISIGKGGVVATFFSCDTDINSVTHGETQLPYYISQIFEPISMSLAKIVYRLVQTIIILSTAPYSTLVPHRSWISHLPVFSTLGRFWYANAFWNFINGFYYGESMGLHLLWPTWIISYDMFIVATFQTALCVGAMIIVDTLHFLYDGGMILCFGKRYLLGKRFYISMKEKVGAK